MVKVWNETVTIPTYPVGAPEKNPMFIEKRVYQGSSGKIYPLPNIESIGDVPEDRDYNAVYLENEYLKICVLPELGGRIQRAYDKTNGYDFVYYNHVIKPALVGLTGPWISGGIEFNWPQHHRPSTYLPVDYEMVREADGSAGVLLNDVDRINGTKAICRIMLRPGKAYIEINGQLYNRTSLPQTFLWWANPAVPVNENTQTVFPPDVTAVMDHGKRDVSRFPIATGTYYKQDYSEGVDISRYKNIPVPTSFMAAQSHYDFVGGYDNGVEAGLLHVADHHISPGKKQWTWGCGDFGKAWDRNLTDEDGPYVELMTGVYTDNQPDFTWLKPFEEKTFTQYFMPYKRIGSVKNATRDAAVNLEVEGQGIRMRAYATAVCEADVILEYAGREVWREHTTLSPVDTLDVTLDAAAILQEAGQDTPDVEHHETSRENAAGTLRQDRLCMSVLSRGRVLVSYQPDPETIPETPEPASAAQDPEDIKTNEELYLTGLHLEQYRHATYRPDDYYLEGLRRDPYDIRINNAYGMLRLRRGEVRKAIPYLEAAIARLTERNPNPYNAESYYNLGLARFYLGENDAAYDAFYKATWTAEQQAGAFYYLAVIDLREGRRVHSLEMIENALTRNTHSIKARALKAVVLRQLGERDAALAWIKENLALDPFDYVSLSEAVRLGQASQRALQMRMRGSTENALGIARDYAEMGCYTEAREALTLTADTPLTLYYEAYYAHRAGAEEAEVQDLIRRAEAADPTCCFPNALEDIPVLRLAMTMVPNCARAPYYLGCLYYDRLRHEEARYLWERAATLDDTFPTVYRNLSLVYYNVSKDPAAAQSAIERAYALDPSDARIFYERDQLYAKLGLPHTQRLSIYESRPDVFCQRDDLCVEYATLLNVCGRSREALDFIMSRRFHPWEGGEGKISAQYQFALQHLAREAMRDPARLAEAEEYLRRALQTPENLGEGKLAGTKDNHIYYDLGRLCERQGRNLEALGYYRRAMQGTNEPAGMMYYNDQPADMILYQGLAAERLGEHAHANARFYRLLDYGERHLRDAVRIDYFAVSLPDFLIYEDDLTVRNEAHCYFLMALGCIGLGRTRQAEEYLRQAIQRNPSDMRMREYVNWQA